MILSYVPELVQTCHNHANISKLGNLVHDQFSRIKKFIQNGCIFIVNKICYKFNWLQKNGVGDAQSCGGTKNCNNVMTINFV